MTNDSELNSQVSLLKVDFLSFTYNIREALIYSILVFAMIINVSIFPLDNLENKEIYISLTALTAAFITYFYLSIIENIRLWSFFTLHGLILINFTIAIILIDVPFYAIFVYIIFIGLSIFSTIIRKSDRWNSYIIPFSIIGLSIVNVVIWYSRMDKLQSELYVEFILSQFIIAIFLLTTPKGKIGGYYQSEISYSIPILSNLALLPVLVEFNFINNSELLGFNISAIYDHYIDIYILVFGLFIVSNTLFIYRNPNLNSSKISTTINISAILLIFEYFREKTDVITNYDQLNVIEMSIRSINLQITIFSIFLLVFFIISILTAIKQKSSSSNLRFTVYSIMGLNLLLSLSLFESDSMTSYWINQPFLSLQLVIPTILFITLKKKESLHFVILGQITNLFFISFIDSKFYIDEIQILTLLLVCIALPIIYLMGYQNNNFVNEYLITLSAYVLFNVISVDTNKYHEFNFSFLLLPLISMIVLDYVKIRKNFSFYAPVFQAINLFILSFKSQRTSFFDQIDLDNLNVFFIIWFSHLIVQSIIFKKKENWIRNSIYTNLALITGLIIFNTSIHNIHDMILVMLITFFSVPLFITQVKADIELTIYAQAFTLIIFGIIEQATFNINHIHYNWVSPLFVIHLGIPVIIQLLNLKNANISLKTSYLSLIAIEIVFALFDLFIEFGNDPTTNDKIGLDVNILGIILIVYLIILPKVKNIEYRQVSLILTYSGLVGLVFYQKPDLIDINRWINNFGASSNWIFSNNIPAINIFTIVFASFIFTTFLFDNKALEITNKDFLKILPLGSIFILSILGITTSYFHQVPIALLSSLVVLYAISELNSPQDKDFRLLLLHSASFLFFFINEHQIFVIINSFELGISLISYLAFGISFAIKLYRSNFIDPIIPVSSIALPAFFGFYLAVAKIGILTPIEIPLIISILIVAIPVFNSVISNKHQFLLLSVSTFSFGIIIYKDLGQLITLNYGDLNYIFSISLVYLLYSIAHYLISLKSNNEKEWLFGYSTHIILIFLLTQVHKSIVHPMILALPLILFSTLLVKSDKIYIREYLTPLLSISIILLFGVPFEITIANRDILFQYILFTILSILILSFWYINGIGSQLHFSVTSIYAQAALISITSITYDILNFEGELIIAVISLTTIFTLIFYSRLATAEVKNLPITLLASQLSIIIIANIVKDEYSGSRELILRIIIDWVVFVPVFIEAVIYLRPYVENYYRLPSTQKQGDIRSISFLLVSLITALFVGAEGIFSIKLLVIAIAFWMFAGVVIRENLSWAASINSVFVFGYILSEYGAGSGEITGEQYTKFFTIMAFFGISMIIAGIINELKYKGEPFTMTLTLTGTVIAVGSISIPWIAPYPWPGVNDNMLALQITQFLPNIMWAGLGLVLFIISNPMKKTYLRRISLSVLLMDILKTGYEIVVLAENELIRIVGAIVLGAVLILIFYLFTKEEENIDEI